jgi:hypothetical protein
MTNLQNMEEKKNKVPKPSQEKTSQDPAMQGNEPNNTVTNLQHQVGNQAVQRLLAQRSGSGPFDLNDETEARINNQRGSGQPLDGSVQTKMGDATGHDFSDVKVHTDPESHALNEELSAKAFTTGQDIFFREGAYQPGSGEGQELIAHELTHVVQQSSGAVGSGNGRMTVNAPGDAYEQEADSVAHTVMTGDAAPAVQRQAVEDEDEVQTKSLQREEAPKEDEEELVQKQEMKDDEELNE